ncbi:MAG: MarR family transcriptional regulator [Oscillospiraceae bacterium]
MNSKIITAINRFYHDLAINDLRLMHMDYNFPNVTYNSLLYLNLIYENQGKYTASALADLLHVSKPAVITKVNELIKQGYLYKKQSERDKRVYFLFAHEDALPEYKAYERMDRVVDMEAKNAYTPEQIDLFCEMLEFVGHTYLEESINENQRNIPKI